VLRWTPSLRRRSRREEPHPASQDHGFMYGTARRPGRPVWAHLRGTLCGVSLEAMRRR
jgi:hypothetical protein